MKYLAEAKVDAQDTVRSFSDEVLEKFLENGEVSDDLLNDYDGGDSYHHERHVDKSYDLLEAATLLDELSEYEETDSGLWEGQKPRDAIATQAAFTYGNAVYQEWQNLIGEINEDDDLCALYDNYNSIEDTIDEELTEHREEAEGEVKLALFEADKGRKLSVTKLFEAMASYKAPFVKDDEVAKRQAAKKAKISARIKMLTPMGCRWQRTRQSWHR